MPRRLQALTRAKPASVRPGPVSGDMGKAKGTPWPKMLLRLQTGPSERRPAAWNTSSAVRSASIASQPSICRTAAKMPSSMAPRISPVLRQSRQAPARSRLIAMEAICRAMSSEEPRSSGASSGVT
ncbi:hypothetical protein D3C72_2040500 [compost metagenome]